MRRVFALALFVAVMVTPPASQSQDAPVYFGGGISPTLAKSGQPVALARSGSTVAGLVALTVGCGHFDVPETLIGVKGTVGGDAFMAHGGSRPVKGLRVRALLSGTFTGDLADRTLKIKMIRARGGPRGCRPPTRTHMTLRRQSAPAGAPAQPTGGMVLRGVTDQFSKGVQLPVTLAVTRDGRSVIGLWLAMAACPGFELPVDNYSPASRIKADGTFSRSEHYRIPYDDGTTDHYRVQLKGRFLTDGATGSVRARIASHDRRGRLLGTCDSGERQFSAAP
jgi:hypothetical protein